MSLTVTEEAVKATDNLRSRVNELQVDLLNAAKALITTFDENKDGLGAHTAKIYALLQDITDEGISDGDVKKLVRRLRLSAMNRKNHMDNSHEYKGRSR